MTADILDEMPDAVVIGSGPNGLSAAIVLARAGCKVIVFEAAETIGGGARSAALTLPGFVHDTCSAIHAFAVLSPAFTSLPLAAHGLEWVRGARDARASPRRWNGRGRGTIDRDDGGTPRDRRPVLSIGSSDVWWTTGPGWREASWAAPSSAASARPRAVRPDGSRSA